MGDNPSEFKSCGDDCPVEQVSWDDVQKFIRKLNQREGTDRYRLPTEAEWEYACRAGSTTRFCFGNNDSGLGEYAWYRDNTRGEPHSVGQKRPNTWGLYDMHGNVNEWCQDRSPSKGPSRMIRGGSWGNGAGDCRSAFRSHRYQDLKFMFLGFRLARTP